MIKKYKTLSLASLALFALTHSLNAQSNPYLMQQGTNIGSNAVIVVVEDRTITNDEVMRSLSKILPQIKAKTRSEAEYMREGTRVRNEIIQNLIDKCLIVKDFKDKGYMIPQAYLDSYFEDYVLKEFNGDRTELLKYVQSQGKTVKQLRTELEEDYIIANMQHIRRKTVSQISPTKIIDYYEKNKDKFFLPANAKVSQITLRSATSSNFEKQKILADDIIKQAREGANFAELAKKYSQDSEASKGGDLGQRKKGDFSPKIDEVVFKLKEGEVSDPIIIDNIIVIFKATEVKPEGIQPIDSVREQIEWDLVEQEYRVANDKWIEGLRKKAYIKYFTQ